MGSKDGNDGEEKVYGALTQAARLLDDAVREQEAAANRILGLAEQLYEHAANRGTRLKAEAIMEACAFQDLSGQKIRKVGRLVRYLRDKRMISGDQLPPPTPAERETVGEGGGLSQADVDRLMSGKPLERKKR